MGSPAPNPLAHDLDETAAAGEHVAEADDGRPLRRRSTPSVDISANRFVAPMTLRAPRPCRTKSARIARRLSRGRRQHRAVPSTLTRAAAQNGPFRHGHVLVRRRVKDDPAAARRMRAPHGRRAGHVAEDGVERRVRERLLAAPARCRNSPCSHWSTSSQLDGRHGGDLARELGADRAARTCDRHRARVKAPRSSGGQQRLDRAAEQQSPVLRWSSVRHGDLPAAAGSGADWSRVQNRRDRCGDCCARPRRIVRHARMEFGVAGRGQALRARGRPGDQEFHHAAGTRRRQIPVRREAHVVDRHVVGMPFDADGVRNPSSVSRDSGDQQPPALSDSSSRPTANVAGLRNRQRDAAAIDESELDALGGEFRCEMAATAASMTSPVERRRRRRPAARELRLGGLRYRRTPPAAPAATVESFLSTFEMAYIVAKNANSSVMKSAYDTSQRSRETRSRAGRVYAPSVLCHLTARPSDAPGQHEVALRASAR